MFLDVLKKSILKSWFWGWWSFRCSYGWWWWAKCYQSACNLSINICTIFCTTRRSILKSIILKIKILKWTFSTHKKTFLNTFGGNFYLLHVFSFIHKTGGQQLSSKVIGEEFLFSNISYLEKSLISTLYYIS